MQLMRKFASYQNILSCASTHHSVVPFMISSNLVLFPNVMLDLFSQPLQMFICKTCMPEIYMVTKLMQYFHPTIMQIFQSVMKNI